MFPLHTPVGDPSAAPPTFIAAWHVDPLVILALGLAAAGYAVGLMRMRERGRRSPGPPRIAAFYFGLATVAFALLGPLDTFNDELFSAHMLQHLALIELAALCLVATVPLARSADKPTDPQIAHIAYTASVIDIEAAKLAVEKSKTPEVVDFANGMIRDHEAVNVQALDLVKKLNVTPEDNDTSKALAQAAAAKKGELAALEGAAFDKAYIDNEVAYHKQVNGALETLLIPSAENPELKALLETGLKLFQGHQQHAEHVAAGLK